MESLAEAMLSGTGEPTGLDDVEARPEQTSQAGPASAKSPGSKRNVLKRGIFKAANMQDKLLEK